QVLGPAYNPAYMAFSLDNPRGGGGGFGPFQSDVRDTRGAGEGLDVQQYSGGDSLSPFSVDEDFSMVLGDEPAWQTQYDMPSVTLSGGADVGGGGAYHSYRTSAGRRAREAPAGEGAAEDAVVTETDAEDASAARAGRAAWSIPMGAGRDMQWHCESPLRWVDLGPDYFPRYLRSADCGHHTCTGSGFVCRPRSFSVKVLRRREGVCAPASDLPREESTVGLPHDLRDMWVWELRAVNFCCVCSMRG
ncbi:Prothoracicotropic hormone, partial [Frankliniella occidentalis]